MTSSSVETDNIVLYPVLEDNRITLGIKEEYHLQKLGIGAYKVTILDENKLNHLSHTQHHIVMENRDCVLVHNCYSEGGITAVLIVTEPFKLRKDSVLCHIAFAKTKDFEVQVDVHEPSMDVVVENLSPPDSTTTHDIISGFEMKPTPRKPHSVFDKFIQQ